MHRRTGSRIFGRADEKMPEKIFSPEYQFFLTTKKKRPRIPDNQKKNAYAFKKPFTTANKPFTILGLYSIARIKFKSARISRFSGGATASLAPPSRTPMNVCTY